LHGSKEIALFLDGPAHQEGVNASLASNFTRVAHLNDTNTMAA